MNLCQLTTTANGQKLDSSDYSNYVRTFLKRYISHKYTRGQSTLLVYLLDPEIEARVNTTEEQPLEAREHDNLIQAILREVESSATPSQVILTSIETRNLLEGLIEKEFPWLAVLSYQELVPEMNIQPLARISWN